MTREETVKMLNRPLLYCDECPHNNCEKCVEAITMAIEALEKEPKRGEWIPIIEGNEFGEPYQSGVYCSECGETLVCEANYCPNCGAKMKE